MHIFITGASGFVGGGIAKALTRVHVVRAMSRSEQSDNSLREMGVTPVRTELGAVSPEHLSGSDVVIHCAAFVSQWGAREQFWTINVDGTDQLIQASRQAGITRFIYIGTEAVVFHGQALREIDETYPYSARTPFLYSESKAAAERLVLTANAPGFETLSIRPRLVWGPGDQTVLPVLKKMVEAGRFVWINGGQARTSTTHIANVAHAVSLALVHGRGGQAYFVTDDTTTTYREFITALLQTQGLTPPNRSLPGWLARSLAFMVESSWRLFGLKTEPPLTRFAAAMMSRECTIRTDKVRQELHYAPLMTREKGLEELRAHA
jgi:nucleoside-diphosphate-sugar epimerase